MKERYLLPWQGRRNEQMRRLPFLILLFSLFNPLQSQVINDHPLSNRYTGYNIEAELNTDENAINGTMKAFWVNYSQDIVPDVQLHLYLNAFSSPETTFFRESGEYDNTGRYDRGWIDILSLTDRHGNDLLPVLDYISPDDGNLNDRTVAKIVLPEPARPGDTIFLNVKFKSKLPTLTNRTGYKDDFYFVAQWFPKFGVYEPAGMRYAVKGSWNCHQFHYHSEFYSNHSIYEVKITVPEKFIVGTCGIVLNTISENGNKILDCRAEDIVDFAWTAWPGYAEYTSSWKNVRIKLLLPADRKNQVDRQFAAVKYALEYYSDKIAPFPWPYLTVIDPPSKGSDAGGMEYTTLFTSLSFYGVPSFFHFPEMVTVHEFGHAYFMGIFANNESEEPWLDEGVNTFWEERIMDHYYGENTGMFDHPLLKISDKSVSRFSYLTSESRQVVSNNEFAWNYPHDTYSMMSYNKAGTWLFTLMGIVGEKTMDEIFREYYRRWAFRHPSSKDFIEVVNDIVRKTHGNEFGQDMNWFFDQTLYGTGICDYKVIAVKNQLMRSDNTGLSGDSSYHALVQLERPGDITLPVDMLVHFENGKEVLEHWDGKTRYRDFEYYSVPRITWVKIDPEFRITMDVNYINNSMTLKPDRTPVKKMKWKLVAFMQFLISFISL
jgi:hypothetical protein